MCSYSVSIKLLLLDSLKIWRCCFVMLCWWMLNTYSDCKHIDFEPYLIYYTCTVNTSRSNPENMTEKFINQNFILTIALTLMLLIYGMIFLQTYGYLQRTHFLGINWNPSYLTKPCLLHSFSYNIRLIHDTGLLPLGQTIFDYQRLWTCLQGKAQ